MAYGRVANDEYGKEYSSAHVVLDADFLFPQKAMQMGPV